MINPEVIVQEGKQDGEEGCLSFPGILFAGAAKPARDRARPRINGKEFEIDGMELDGALHAARNGSLRRHLFTTIA